LRLLYFVYFVYTDAECREGTRAKDVWPYRIITVVLRVGASGARRQWRNGRDRAWLNSDTATIRLDNRSGAAGTHHDGVTDIGVNTAVYRLISLTLTDRKIAVAWLNRSGPGRSCQGRGAPKCQYSAQERLLAHNWNPPIPNTW